MKSKVNLAAQFGRLAVWGLVVVWCLVPVVWLLFMLVSNAVRGQANPNPVPPFRGQPGDQGLMMQVMSSAFLLGAFVYGMWCSVGVVIGFGVDRAITVLESLATEYKPILPKASKKDSAEKKPRSSELESEEAIEAKA